MKRTVWCLALALALGPAWPGWGQVLEHGGVLVDELGAARAVNRTFVDATLLGDTEAVPAQGAGIRVRLLGVYCQSALAVTLRFKSAGANNVSAGFAVAANGSLSMPYNPHGWLQTNPNEALNLNQSLAVSTGCNLVWVKAV